MRYQFGSLKDESVQLPVEAMPAAPMTVEVLMLLKRWIGEVVIVILIEDLKLMVEFEDLRV